MHTVSFSLAFHIVLHPQGIRKQMKMPRKRHRVHISHSSRLFHIFNQETNQTCPLNFRTHWWLLVYSIKSGTLQMAGGMRIPPYIHQKIFWTCSESTGLVQRHPPRFVYRRQEQKKVRKLILIQKKMTDKPWACNLDRVKQLLAKRVIYFIIFNSPPTSPNKCTKKILTVVKRPAMVVRHCYWLHAEAWP